MNTLVAVKLPHFSSLPAARPSETMYAFADIGRREAGSGLIQLKSQVRLVVDVILAENTGQLGQMLVAEYESEQLQIHGKTGVVTTWLPIHRLVAIHTNRQQPLITLDEYLGYRVSGSSGPFPVQRQSRHSPWHLPRY